jgi:hypothetical protein
MCTAILSQALAVMLWKVQRLGTETHESVMSPRAPNPTLKLDTLTTLSFKSGKENIHMWVKI